MFSQVRRNTRNCWEVASFVSFNLCARVQLLVRGGGCASYDSAVVCAVVSIGGGGDGTASIVDLDSYLQISATCMSSTNK